MLTQQVSPFSSDQFPQFTSSIRPNPNCRLSSTVVNGSSSIRDSDVDRVMPFSKRRKMEEFSSPGISTLSIPINGEPHVIQDVRIPIPDLNEPIKNEFFYDCDLSFMQDDVYTNSGRPKKEAFSLIDSFGVQEIREHNYALRKSAEEEDSQNKWECEGSGAHYCQLCQAKKELDLNGIEEDWIQCCKCKAWQHQICALFNGKRNGKEQHKYICPMCCISEIRSGIRKPLPKSSIPGAKDLPKTILSDYIENRLFKRLREERLERSQHLERDIEDVEGVEGLVVRVVSCVEKTLNVEKPFREIFQHENYPTKFPYKSKFILLFQNIDGADVCLFGMMVQEFGSDCLPPNQRCVYLSYLDSVKYFSTDIKTSSRETLRTFVYHEVLIGYLQYCKIQGFTTCYLYADPPTGVDFLFHCHPKSQKIPSSAKLRGWYLSVAEKAVKESIVVRHTNVYDHFFVAHRECRAKVTASRLPYCEGDYLSSALDDIAEFVPENASKDSYLMERLGNLISPDNKNFILLHLQHSCSHCCVFMLCGDRWICHQCKDFQLCNKCYNEEQTIPEKVRHPTSSAEKHVLQRVQVVDVPADTKDRDDVFERKCFDSRQGLLNLCQDNNYQFDTLRRAKHSSMMLLYYLHNPAAQIFEPT